MREIPISKYELEQMYVDEGMSMPEIAEKTGISHSTVYRKMKYYGITRRNLLESMRLKNPIQVPREELEEMYLNKKMSINEIAEEINMSPTTLYYWMKRYEIPIRSISESRIGEKNPSWKGGTTYIPYCNRFNNKFKELVRNRDNHTCQLCGYEQGIYEKKLSIHHIHYDKENCYPDVVALCQSCNARVNTNRDHWEDFFKTQLILRGLLNWSIETEVS